MSSLPDLTELEVWFVVGSQHLYGTETLEKVADHARQLATAFNSDEQIPVRVVFKSVLTGPDEIRAQILAANQAPACIGLIAWMHTFSPAKMWIGGLNVLQKPLLHLHTQFNREIPWSTIDMDFMNLNQSAHGGREFGHLAARLRMNRKVVVGHWQEPGVRSDIGVWCRAAAARHDLQSASIARLGDNMREVAVTEGDKVSAELTFGFSVNGYGLGDVAEYVNETSDAETDALCREYDEVYAVADELGPDGDRRERLRDAARIELALRQFLEAGEFVGFTDTFENLHGLQQLPGIAAQRLMADGYGFGAEGDWKAAAMVRAAKVMGQGLAGGTSFMEDYTYHFLPDGGQVLGAHMLEICPSTAAEKPRCEIHPLSIGGKEDPVRLVFTAAAGPAVNVATVDLGDRFRMVLNEVEAAAPDEELPRLPVARALWTPQPDIRTAAAAWIYAGGSHHPTFSQALSTEHFADFAEMFDVELTVIDAETRLREFKERLRFGDAAYGS